MGSVKEWGQALLIVVIGGGVLDAIWVAKNVCQGYYSDMGLKKHVGCL
jgi:hypothetical protein